MNRKQAAAIRHAQLRGEPVKALDLQQAINVLSTRRQNKLTIPALRDEVRARVNSLLLLNLGVAIGRAEGRKAA